MQTIALFTSGPRRRPRFPLVGQFLIALGFRFELRRHFRDSVDASRVSRGRSNAISKTSSMFSTNRMVKAGLNFRRDIRQILFIVLGENHGANPHAMSGQQFFLHAADGQDLAAQGDFAGHGHVAAHRDARQGADDGGGRW